MKKEVKQHISKAEITELENWLLKEYRSNNSGFYSNWDTIKQSINSNRAFFLFADNTIVGFLTYTALEKVILIELMEVKPQLRGKGLGKYLFSYCKERFSALGFKAANLECIPLTSQVFWRQVGFFDIPQSRSLKSLYVQENVRLYSPLVETAESCITSEEAEIIELWDDEPRNIQDSTPTWAWEVNYFPFTNKLKNPIIHPSMDHWKLRWRKGSKIHFEKRVKEFKNQEIYFNDFLIIEAL